MFLGNAILKAFWMDFGRVLKDQNPGFFRFLGEKMQAKNKNVAKKRPSAKNSANKAPERGERLADPGRRWCMLAPSTHVITGILMPIN